MKFDAVNEMFDLLESKNEDAMVSDCIDYMNGISSELKKSPCETKEDFSKTLENLQIVNKILRVLYDYKRTHCADDSKQIGLQLSGTFKYGDESKNLTTREFLEMLESNDITWCGGFDYVDINTGNIIDDVNIDGELED